MILNSLLTEDFKMDFAHLIKDKVFGAVITVLLVCSIMLIANVLRRKIRFLRRSLIPTAVLAGLLGLIVKEILLWTTGFNIFSTATLGALVYHALPIGFIALCLREKDDYTYEFNKDKVKKERVAGTKSGTLIISTYLMQALIGVGVTFIFSYIISGFNGAAGLMLPLGFGQGPQQASAAGSIWDTDGYFSAWGEGSAVNFGITVAAMGFLWASIPGIILVNRAAKRKGVKRNINEYQKSGELSSHSIEGPDEVPLSESIDKFTLQVCMVGAVYLLTIGIIMGLELIFAATGVKFLTDLIPTIWGFAFMFAVLVALLVKVILRKLVKTGVMRRIYPNSYMMNRISGAAFDLSIAAALFMISIKALGILWVPIIVMSALGGVASIFYLRFLCNRIYKDYKDEAFLGMYGMLTGTIANGMILLREIDNGFATPAADDLVKGSSAAIVLGLPLLLLIAQAPAAGRLWWTMLVIAGYFAILTAYQFGIFKKLRKKKNISSQETEEK